jgi:hypothetical protein
VGVVVTLHGQLREPPIPHATGQSVTPSFEGWYPNPDGTFTLSFGYFNRNFQEALDIPIGPNNHIEPGPADQGQPTLFLTRRHTGVFTVVVPSDFGTTNRVTWTLVSGGETISIPGHLRPEWKIDALKEATSGNTPPVVRLEPDGKFGQGPGGARISLHAAVGVPLSLNVWVTDDGIFKETGGGEGRAALGVVWSEFRGPAPVAFTETEPKLDEAGKATTVARFTEPGDYVLRVLAWDSSGRPGLVMAGGFQCCWTNGYVDVKVQAKASQTSRKK